MANPNSLSPAAKAILEAAFAQDDPRGFPNLAAALRATAEQLLKEDDVWLQKTDDTLEHVSIEWVPFHSILSIARELELLDV